MAKVKKIPNHIRKTARFAALEVLIKVSQEQAYSNLLIKDAIKQAELNDQDGRLMTELVYGTISRQLTLEYYLAPFIKNAKKVDNWVKHLLMMSLYQSVYLDKIPAYSIVDEAVTIAKAKGNPGTGKFVNGVLRTIQRKGIPSLDDIEDQVEKLSIEISLPLWMTERFVSDIGLESTRELGLSLLKPSHVSARVDTRIMSREQAVEVLRTEGIDARLSKVSSYGVVADKGFLANSSLFKKGVISVQDESSMLVAPTLQLEPSSIVLDACAAPGGKTTHIATFLNAEEEGKVVSLDIHQHKLNLISENATRLGLESVVEPQLLDARKVDATFSKNSFDRILVDAPCSGLGLLRRKPDIKYRKTEKDFVNLQKIQLDILESVASCLKPDGIITYSTCTIIKEENRDVVESFLKKHPNFERIDIQGVDHLKESYKNQMLQLYPHQYHTDGFFISCLRRKA